MPKTARICQVGAGRAANVHANSLRNHVPPGRLVAVLDTVPGAFGTTGDEYSVEARFDSLEAALDWGALDAVAITMPTFTHTCLATMAADRSKHVFLEKPMSSTLSECDRIILAVGRNGVPSQLGFMRRFEPEFAPACERIQGRKIGRAMVIKSLTHGPGLPPARASGERITCCRNVYREGPFLQVPARGVFWRQRWLTLCLTSTITRGDGTEMGCPDQ